MKTALSVLAKLKSAAPSVVNHGWPWFHLSTLTPWEVHLDCYKQTVARKNSSGPERRWSPRKFTSIYLFNFARGMVKSLSSQALATFGHQLAMAKLRKTEAAHRVAKWSSWVFSFSAITWLVFLEVRNLHDGLYDAIAVFLIIVAVLSVLFLLGTWLLRPEGSLMGLVIELERLIKSADEP
ncbi:hypothetical protein SAMN02746095_03361 [Acidocella aminolytica 101 = DSM 11237]|nr:hypothetical protein SAMN02746095_03361 [Acidocella aminolytica 101 = DSM 11237]